MEEDGPDFPAVLDVDLDAGVCLSCRRWTLASSSVPTIEGELSRDRTLPYRFGRVDRGEDSFAVIDLTMRFFTVLQAGLDNATRMNEAHKLRVGEK